MSAYLENQLRDLDPLPTHNMGKVGDWSLDQAPELGVEVWSIIAQKTGLFDTYNQFSKRFNSNPERPIRPEEDDPRFDPAGEAYEKPIDKIVAKKVRYERAYNTYLNEVQNYNTEKTNAHKIRSGYDHSFTGYLGYCRTQVSELEKEASFPFTTDEMAAFAKKKRSLPIAEPVAQLGSFIVGNHGSGKSEIIKHRVWHYLTKERPTETIVVIDPHGELAYEIARMKPNLDNDRLVLFDPFLMDPFVPCMSILNTANKSEDNLKSESEAYGSALEMISGGEMSENMTALCERASHIILERDEFNILDLMKLVNVGPPKRGQPERPYPPVYRYAAEKSCNFIIRDFFKDNFLYGNFSQAKNGLYERITRVVTSPVVQRMLLNPPSLDFGKLIDQRKVIIISLPMSRLGDHVTKMLGQMIVAQIQLAVLKRDPAKLKRYPQVHLMMDEAHHFVSPETAKQINELRKFGLALTLATQYVDQFPSSILEAVRGLGVQIAGLCVGKNLTEMNTTFGLKKSGRLKEGEVDEASLLSNLSVGNFFFKVRGTAEVPSVKARQFSTDTSLLFNKPKWQKHNAANFMTDEEWERCKQDQIAKYYRRVDPKGPIETLGEPDTTYTKTRSEIDQEFRKLEPVSGFD